MLAAIDQGAPDSVYVMVVENGENIAGMGGLMGTAMHARDFSGAVIDGGTRDVAYLYRKSELSGLLDGHCALHFDRPLQVRRLECSRRLRRRVPPARATLLPPMLTALVVPRKKAAEVLAVAQDMDFKEHSMYAWIEKLKSIEEAVKKFGRL